ncbi:MAG: PepSY domain-containing protein [Lysobacterales bacterium]
MARNGSKTNAVRRLHRSLGVLGAVFLIWMTVSGILINHSDDLGFATHQVSQPLLLDWYGLAGPERVTSYRLGDVWLSFAGSQLYFNGEALTTLAEGAGAVRMESMLVAAGSRELLLLDHQARLVERLPWTSPGMVEDIGLHGGAVIVRAADQLWLADAQLISWKALETPATAVSWSAPEPAPAAVLDQVVAAYRGQGLSLQRVLLDVHSGQFFGSKGVWVYDLLALLVCLLAGSGLVLWFRARSRSYRNKRR